VTVVGAGVFGVAGALELSRRGYTVRVLDSGTVPRPAASSTDISKAVRSDYGNDEFYTDLAARAIVRWREWNREWDEPLFHEVGILLLSRDSMEPGGFEADSMRLQLERGVPVERLDGAALARRYPAWSRSTYADGYLNPRAGYVESGRVMQALISRARAAGVEIREGVRCVRLHQPGDRVAGVVLEGGEILGADFVLVSAGAWTGFLLPWLSEFLWATGQPVVYFRPLDPRPFEGARFPVWCGDIARTGWYGFPVNPEGVLKVGHHGPGRRIGPDDPLDVTEAEERESLEFVRATFPALGNESVLRTRLCLYCDTWDGDFLIDHDPQRPGLMVAAGGSGHGFKFAPLLGQIIADVLERKPNREAQRFAWRQPGQRRAEQARKGSS
jgi:glycine/D-amino acid oxidase-like deaminating enzyme